MSALTKQQKSVAISLLNKQWLKAKTPPEKVLLASAMRKLMGLKPSKEKVSIVSNTGAVLYKGTDSNRAIKKAETSNVVCSLVSETSVSKHIPGKGWTPLREKRA